MSSWWRGYGTWRMVYLLFLGQLVSFIMALMSFSSSLIADLGNNWKRGLSFFFFLFTLHGFLKLPWWWMTKCIKCDDSSQVVLVFGEICAGVDAPLTQMFFAYLALALVFGSILLYRRRRLLVLHCFVGQFLSTRLWPSQATVFCLEIGMFFTQLASSNAESNM